MSTEPTVQPYIPAEEQPAEIVTIRNLLMGAHIQHYSAQLSRIDQTILQNEAAFHQRMKESEEAINAHFDQLEQHIHSRFSALEALVEANVQRLDKRISEVSNKDKVNLGQMLAEISSRLTNFQE